MISTVTEKPIVISGLKIVVKRYEVGEVHINIVLETSGGLKCSRSVRLMDYVYHRFICIQIESGKQWHGRNRKLY